MKKLITLIMAGCLVLGSLATASAIDVKVTGQWEFSYGYYTNRSLSNSESDGHLDNTDFRMRARTQVHFIASETLSALLNFEIGDLVYGGGSGRAGYGGDGGALDADGVNVAVKRAHLDWIIPMGSGAKVKTRMGIQGIALPTFVTDSGPVFQADVAGVSATLEMDQSPVAVTAFWARPFDAYAGESSPAFNNGNAFDEMDVFGVIVPVKTSIINVSPYAVAASIGADSGYFNATDPYAYKAGSGRGRAVPRGEREDQAFAWWAGFALELPILNPFFVKIDGVYGSMDAKSDYDYDGWMVAADIGYKWNVLGGMKTSVIGFYSTGDDGDEYGTLPLISDDWGFTMTSYGLNAGRGINRDSIISGTGQGMWGLGVKVADVSFMQNLSHEVIAMYMRGTNSGETMNNGSTVGMHYSTNGYLLSSDTAWEIDLNNKYVFNENLSMALDFAYVNMDLSKQRASSVRDSAEDSFATMLSFQYKF